MIRQAAASLRWRVLGRLLRSTRKAPLANVRRLIERLHPIQCGIDLIRVGAARDGGYLIPDDLDGIEYCLSPGVNTTADFENDLADHGIRSYLADYSVSAPPITRPEFTFDKIFIGGSDHGAFLTLSTWKESHLKGYRGDLLLQMDIEGSEYGAILGTPDCLLDQFRIMVIEFHELDRIFDSFSFGLINDCFERLLRYFYVVHIHPNSWAHVTRQRDLAVPAAMEFTFLNKRRVKYPKPNTTFPHYLDASNGRFLSPLSLPVCWYL